jgi:hypothetical protein
MQLQQGEGKSRDAQKENCQRNVTTSKYPEDNPLMHPNENKNQKNLSMQSTSFGIASGDRL